MIHTVALMADRPGPEMETEIDAAHHRLLADTGLVRLLQILPRVADGPWTKGGIFTEYFAVFQVERPYAAGAVDLPLGYVAWRVGLPSVPTTACPPGECARGLSESQAAACCACRPLT